MTLILIPAHPSNQRSWRQRGWRLAVAARKRSHPSMQREYRTVHYNCRETAIRHVYNRTQRNNSVILQTLAQAQRNNRQGLVLEH